MGLYGGMDIGSRSIELVVRDPHQVLSRHKTATTFDPLTQIKTLLEGFTFDRLVATGYGRGLVGNATLCPLVETITEIKAYALRITSYNVCYTKLLRSSSPDLKFTMEKPVMSDGVMSGVNWMRLNEQSMRQFARLISLMNGAGVVWIFALMFLISADIIGRTVFDSPIRGVAEMVSLFV